jgi:hypothetical protein
MIDIAEAQPLGAHPVVELVMQELVRLDPFRRELKRRERQRHTEE